MELIGSYLPYLLLQLPSLLPLLVGIMLAVMYWKYHSRISLLAVIGFVLLFLATLLRLGTTLSPTFMMQMGLSMSSYSIFVAVVSVARSLFEIVGMSLVVAAVFSGRRSLPSAEKNPKLKPQE